MIGPLTAPPVEGGRSRRSGRWIGVAAAATLLGGCALNGDFGRVRPELVGDDIHAWVGREAIASTGVPASEFPLTDDERLLRDLAYGLIEPPYNRNQWDSVWREYGFGRLPSLATAPFDRAIYWLKIKTWFPRSEVAAYARLSTDARNDVVRIEQFAPVAQRVLDMDRRRALSMAQVGGLTPGEGGNALARNAENAGILAWVCTALSERIIAYRYALERLVIAVPAPAAADADRSIVYLQGRVRQCCAPAARPAVVVAKD